MLQTLDKRCANLDNKIAQIASTQNSHLSLMEKKLETMKITLESWKELQHQNQKSIDRMGRKFDD